MMTMQSTGRAALKDQSIMATRSFIAALKKNPALIEDSAGIQLESIEAAAHIVQSTKTLWFVATSAGLDDLARKLEQVFYDAFVAARRYPVNVPRGDLPQPCESAIGRLECGRPA